MLRQYLLWERRRLWLQLHFDVLLLRLAMCVSDAVPIAVPNAVPIAVSNYAAAEYRSNNAAAEYRSNGSAFGAAYRSAFGAAYGRAEQRSNHESANSVSVRGG